MSMNQNSCAVEEKVFTFKDLDNLTFRWQTDLPEYYHQFILQTEALNTLMFEQVALMSKVSTIIAILLIIFIKNTTYNENY